MTIHAQQFPTPLGPMLAAVDDAGSVLRLAFLGGRDAQSLAREGARRNEAVEWDDGRCAAVVAQVEEYFAGQRRDFDLPLAPRGSEFQQRVWAELVRIPYGATISYGELARRVGNPAASRAVGRANATNPIPVIVPCHRVIGANGTLTGYAGGVDLKHGLLHLEGALPAEQPALAVA
jgi:methylated-DNA-[protein]-cysteine S-methyltransferase